MSDAPPIDYLSRVRVAEAEARRARAELEEAVTVAMIEAGREGATFSRMDVARAASVTQQTAYRWAGLIGPTRSS